MYARPALSGACLQFDSPVVVCVCGSACVCVCGLSGPRLAEVYLLRLLASVRDEPGSAGSAKVKALYSKLAEMDPHHANFYAYAAASTSPMLGDLSASPPQPSPAVDATA